MMNARKIPAAQYKHLPSYQELAQLVVDLTRHNISNLHMPQDWWFVNCYTYSGKIPEIYQRAIKAHDSLIGGKVVAGTDSE